MENVERLKNEKSDHFYDSVNEAFPEGDNLLDTLKQQLNFLNDKFSVYQSLDTITNYEHIELTVNKAEGDLHNSCIKEIQM
jgi:hypothetical protein